jgi:hypothetical protein
MSNDPLALWPGRPRDALTLAKRAAAKATPFEFACPACQEVVFRMKGNEAAARPGVAATLGAQALRHHLRTKGCTLPEAPEASRAPDGVRTVEPTP